MKVLLIGALRVIHGHLVRRPRLHALTISLVDSLPGLRLRLIRLASGGGVNSQMGNQTLVLGDLPEGARFIYFEVFEGR